MMAEKKKTKYDTNPLDGEYARRADDEWGATRRVEPKPEEKEVWPAEAPTKRYDSSIPVSYPSIHVPPSYPPRAAGLSADATPQATPAAQAPPARNVPGLGLPENVTLALPYVPFFIGGVIAAIELAVTPREETKARFYAAQGLALQLAALVITLIFNFVGRVTGTGIGGSLFWTASTIFFIINTIRILKGGTLHIAPAQDAADWLNEKIEPQKLKPKKK
jgi:hypothetical protein